MIFGVEKGCIGNKWFKGDRKVFWKSKNVYSLTIIKARTYERGTRRMKMFTSGYFQLFWRKTRNKNALRLLTLISLVFGVH